MNEAMISVEEARARILDAISRLPPETKPLEDALGQVLAEDVSSPLTIPPRDNTSMDGYAVRAADTEDSSQASPRELRVIGEVAAGYTYDGELQPGSAVRIMTGAPIPAGADAVVPFEETDEEPGRAFGAFAKGRDHVGVFKTARPGANVRRAGEDVQAGSLVLSAGAQLGAAQLGVLASVGKRTVSVYRRPIVAVLSTGDELLGLDQPYEHGKIYDSNAASIAALISEAGGIPLRLGIARDTVEDLTAKLRHGLGADLLVTSAGVSRGDYDVVKDVLEREGEVDFWTVRMRPGKPLAFGAFPAPDGRRVPHIGLPGNPVSSMVTFELFGRAAIFKLMGKTSWERQTLRVTVEDRVVNDDGRRFLARAIVRQRDGRYFASLTGSQSSGVLTSMALANALVVCPEDVPALESGQEADAIMLGPVTND
ncbi:MAG: molybdopterin molybdenumtransferase MoeA [Dehalococcoidia bacterium]|nr:molybdopterin molybdenumtransferase MoeA [Dehalococcoidia bacterium]